MRELLRIILSGFPGVIALVFAVAGLMQGYVNVGRGPRPKVVRRETDPVGYWLIIGVTLVAGVALSFLAVSAYRALPVR